VASKILPPLIAIILWSHNAKEIEAACWTTYTFVRVHDLRDCVLALFSDSRVARKYLMKGGTSRSRRRAS